MDHESIDLFKRYQDGDEQAATDLYNRYVERLIGLARSRISKKLARHVDPEDVAHSVYRSFFRQAREDRYTLEKSGDLWRLLAGITVNKVLQQVEKHQQRKRDIDQEHSSVCMFRS